MEDKVKGFIKKINNPFSSSSSGKFKGQGRTLGSSDPSPSSNPSRPSLPDPNPNPNPKPSSFPTPAITKSIPNPNPKPSSSTTPASTRSIPPPQQPPSDPQISNGSNTNLELSSLISSIQSRGVSVDVIIRILKNIIKEPENPKFRRIRLSNPKIKEAIVDVVGGVELLELLRFKLQDEDGEMWAVMSDVSVEDCGLIKEAVLLLEQPVVVPGFSIRRNSSTSLLEKDAGCLESSVGVSSAVAVEEVELTEKIDRQVQVFFSVPESITAKADLPESFYSLSAMELKREADARKKQLADSQLLIPKSYKEKKAKEAKKKYKTTTIRIQFPDQVVLQGIFVPGEPTTALYEFVSSALKEPCLEFELWQPAYPKPRVIPRFPQPNKRTQTLEDEELVPAALIKFKPIETDSVVFTGLSNELLESCLATQS